MSNQKECVMSSLMSEIRACVQLFKRNPDSQPTPNPSPYPNPNPCTKCKPKRKRITNSNPNFQYGTLENKIPINA